MDAKQALKAHMAKGMKSAHPDAAVKNMRAGGKTNSDMLKMGRNLAKVANQKSPGRRMGRGG
jgi:hypothetical protein